MRRYVHKNDQMHYVIVRRRAYQGDTCWYAMQPDEKIPTKNWAMEGAQYQVKVCGDHESNPGEPIMGSWDQIWLPDCATCISCKFVHQMAQLEMVTLYV